MTFYAAMLVNFYSFLKHNIISCPKKNNWWSVFFAIIEIIIEMTRKK